MVILAILRVMKMMMVTVLFTTDQRNRQAFGVNKTVCSNRQHDSYILMIKYPRGNDNGLIRQLYRLCSARSKTYHAIIQTLMNDSLA